MDGADRRPYTILALAHNAELSLELLRVTDVRERDQLRIHYMDKLAEFMRASEENRGLDLAAVLGGGLRMSGREQLEQADQHDLQRGLKW